MRSPFGLVAARATGRPLVHLLAHLLAGLADETVNQQPRCAGLGPGPNTALPGMPAPWQPWIAAGLLPPPTPGAMFCDRGPMRPRAQCLLRDEASDTALCEICHQVITAATYARVSLMDGFEPQRDLESPSGFACTLTVRTNAPRERALAAEWRFDAHVIAAAVAPATSRIDDGAQVLAPDVPTAWLVPGVHTVRFLAADRTAASP